MNKITFNTGRAVSREGQVITAVEHSDATVLFHDHSLSRAGRILTAFQRAKGQTLREFVMRHYDAGDYVPDTHALRLVRAVMPAGQHEYLPEDQRADREELLGERFEHDGMPIQYSGEPYKDAPVHFIVNYHVIGQPSIQYTDLVVDSDSPGHAMATVISDKANKGARVAVVFIEPTYRRHMVDYDRINDRLRAGPGWFVDADGSLNPATFQPHR